MKTVRHNLPQVYRIRFQIISVCIKTFHYSKETLDLIYSLNIIEPCAECTVLRLFSVFLLLILPVVSHVVYILFSLTNLSKGKFILQPTVKAFPMFSHFIPWIIWLLVCILHITWYFICVVFIHLLFYIWWNWNKRTKEGRKERTNTNISV